jgi:hypothetical protein
LMALAKSLRVIFERFMLYSLLGYIFFRDSFIMIHAAFRENLLPASL